MPPIPSTFSEEILDLISTIHRRQTDLVESQIPRLRSCKGPLSLQQNIAAELREDIDTFSRQVEALDICVEDQKGVKNRVELRAIVDKLQDSLNQLRRDFRASLLASKREIDSQNKSQKDELLASSVIAAKRTGDEKVTEDALMKANDDVTEALHRTLNLMQGELERSVLSSQMLDASTASLRSTSSRHDTLTNLMGTSKQLITALEKSDWLDRVLIISAFVFFLSVVLFIVKQRIVDRGLRVALWWTRFLPDFSGDANLLMEKGGAMISSNTLPSTGTLSLSTATLTAGSIPSPVPSEVFDTSISELYSHVISTVSTGSEHVPSTIASEWTPDHKDEL